MNHLSILFCILFEAWNADAAADNVNRLAAELTSRVAAELYDHKLRHCTLLVVEPEQVSRYQGLNLFLQSYGLRLGLKMFKSGRGCLLGIGLIPREQGIPELRAKVHARRREKVTA